MQERKKISYQIEVPIKQLQELVDFTHVYHGLVTDPDVARKLLQWSLTFGTLLRIDNKRKENEDAPDV